jgi:hypothetical protein
VFVSAALLVLVVWSQAAGGTLGTSLPTRLPGLRLPEFPLPEFPRPELPEIPDLTCLVPLPEPELGFGGVEEYQANGADWIRYRLTVENRDEYAESLFAKAPHLPACGANASASRTWVEIRDAADDSYIYGFCALGSPGDLDGIWFAVPAGEAPPAQVYVVLRDRECDRTFTSNPVETPRPQCFPELPEPELAFLGTEEYSTAHGDFVRYRLSVENRDEYPAALFAPAPHLPPCGVNASAARAWVNIFDGDGNRIYGFCALGDPENLGDLWFAVPAGDHPPRTVYITIEDRECDRVVGSNRVLVRPEFRRGDVNDDTHHNFADLLGILSATLVGDWSAIVCREAADFNDDGAISVADGIEYLDWKYGTGMPPAAPGVACGQDPASSPAYLGCEGVSCD